MDEYIALQREEVRPALATMRAAIREAVPDAVERISWSMPTYWRRFAAKSFSFSLPFSLYTKKKEDHFPYRSRHHRATSFTSSSGKGRS